MKALPTEFDYDGFHFRQLAREGDVALFEKRKPTHSRASYEVAIVQQHPAETIHGREYPDRESMPPSETWGALGWTPSDLESAKTKFGSLVQSRRNAHFTRTPFPAGASDAAQRLRTADTTPAFAVETPQLPLPIMSA